MIGSYVGCEGVAIDIESVDEVYEAFDVLHTQVLDNLGEDNPCLQILSEAMDKVEALQQQSGKSG